MKRWIVEGIRPDGGAWNAKVELVEAPDRSKALAHVRSKGRMHGFQMSVRPALPGDEPATLERQLNAAVRGAAEELERLVSHTAEELELQLELEPDDDAR
jgi:hypothetical protein